MAGEKIIEALKYLAGNDMDFALEPDNVGFNKFDSVFGHSLSEKTFLTYKQATAAFKLLEKYKNSQLLSQGIIWEDLKPIPEQFEDKKKDACEIINVIKISLAKKNINLKFQYDKVIVEMIKKIYGRKWKPEEKVWEIPLSSIPELFKFIEEIEDTFINSIEIKIDKGIKEKFLELEKMKKLSNAEFSIKKDFPVPEGLRYYQFQKAGIEWLERTNGRALVGDEMGTGKTVTSIGWLNLHPEIRPVLIICPSSVKYNWRNEIEKWTLKNKKTFVMKNNRCEIPENIDFVITNYALFSNVYWKKITKKTKRKEVEKYILREISKIQKKNEKNNIEMDEKEIKDLAEKNFKKRYEKKENDYKSFIKKMNRFSCIILDESHKISNNNSQRIKVIKEIVKGVKYLIMLTGTPLRNRPINLFTQINLLDKETFGNWKNYVIRYCDGHMGNFGWDVSGASNLEELQNKLRSTIMIRRMKKDVLKELPEKVRSFIPFEVEISKNYKEMRSKIGNISKEIKALQRKKQVKKNDEVERKNIESLLRKGQGAYFAEMSRIRRELFEIKKYFAFNFISDTLESEEKIVVFVHHRDAYDFLQKMFDENKITYTGIRGGTPLDQRADIIEKFQNDKTQVFLASIGAAREGITLTSSNVVIFTELDWVPSSLKQAEDRCHRIGQGKNVFVYYLVAENTLDTYMAKIIEEKIDVIGQTVDIDFNKIFFEKLFK